MTTRAGKSPRKDLSLEQAEPDKAQQAKKKNITKPRQFRKKAQEAIGENYATIVNTLAEKAGKGSVQHTKLLFDLGGVKEEVKSASRKRKTPSLGKLLLKEAEAMKRSEEQSASDSTDPQVKMENISTLET